MREGPVEKPWRNKPIWHDVEHRCLRRSRPLWHDSEVDRRSADQRTHGRRRAEFRIQGRLVQVRKLLSAGADVNARYSTQSGQTLLHAAAWNGDLPLVRLLVAKGADLYALDQEHETTPAHWARVALEAFHRQSCEPV